MTKAPQSSGRWQRLSVWVLACGALSIPPLAAQAVTLAAETPVLASPGGAVVAVLPKGARVTGGTKQGAHAALPLSGWVFGGSLGPTNRDGFDIGVTAAAGENLRATPNGAVLARLRTGALFKKVSTKGGWSQVQRTVWIATAALGGSAPTAPPTAIAPSGRPGQGAPAATRPPLPAGAPAAATAPAGADSVAPDTLAMDARRIRLARPAEIYLAPDKGKLGSLVGGATLQPVARARGWVRVRVEGWVREQEIDGKVTTDADIVTAADVRANPAKFEGQPVDWRVQFVAVRTADELRPELPSGQPYALVRGPLPEPGFVYLSLSDEQAQRFRKLSPLAELSIRGIIRTGRTRYTGTPVVELERITEGG